MSRITTTTPATKASSRRGRRAFRFPTGSPRRARRSCRRPLLLEPLEHRLVLDGFGFEIGGTVSADWVDAWRLTTDDAANVYVAGRFRGTIDFNSADGVQTTPDGTEVFQGDPVGSEPYDGFVAKYDSSSNFQWAYVFGGSGHQSANGVELDETGNIYVLGDSYDYTPSLRKLSQGPGGPSLEWVTGQGGITPLTRSYSGGMAVNAAGTVYVETHAGYYYDIAALQHQRHPRFGHHHVGRLQCLRP